ncbi:MAG: hypothetical protein LBD37_02135 [Treponema sp.]|jgi:histidinol dehydrogenase|nr:hypothetical protein [Treponema sp.]
MCDVQPGPVENHRSRESGVLVYPVFSRRSKGLSVGINLFPDRKVCSFDCPYCEVFPFQRDAAFRLDLLETELRATLRRLKAGEFPVRDISFSGNGEPSLAPQFHEALEATARIRDQEASGAALVLITNGTGLLSDQTFDLLRRFAAGPERLSIWLKLDAGTGDWYARMNRSPVPFNALLDRIRELVRRAPVILQTMLCRINGEAPSAEEAAAWTALATELAGLNAAPGAGIQGVQIYGKARPAPEDPLAEALGPDYLEDRAQALQNALGRAIPVEVFV